MNTTARRSILPIDPVDIHSISPREDELVTEEVIGYLNNININTDLLNENDPLRDEYTKFLNDMGNSPIIITNEDIGIDESKSYFDDIDFSNDEKPESYGLNITRDYFISNRLWANGIFCSTIFPICPQYVEPTQIDSSNIETRKIAGEKVEFVRVQYEYEPQELANLNYLTVNK